VHQTLSVEEQREDFLVPREKLLSCLRKRDLLNSDRTDPAQLGHLGTRYLEEGRISDALDLFEKAHDREGLTSLLTRCLAEGDFFLYRRVSRVLGISPAAGDWTKLGDAALSLGKLHFARSAYREAGAPEKLIQVETLINRSREGRAHETVHIQ
jgi:cytochrome c-type biogenesis protein CcmH/NrfG